MKNETILQIENLTQDILNDTYREEQIVPPINLKKILEKNSIKIGLGEFEDPDIDGAYDRMKRIIYLKKNTLYTRMAFTVAHELGHYFLHKDKSTEIFYRNDALQLDDERREQEREANWFAASLLMPREAVKEFWLILKDTNQLADRFCVSYTAAYWRLRNLGLV